MPGMIRDSIAQDGCPAVFDVRTVESPEATELYINVRSVTDSGDDDAIAAIYGKLAATLRGHSARLFSERIFVGGEATRAIGATRRDALGDLDDGVPPTVLATPPPDTRIHGIQVHAVSGEAVPEPIEHAGTVVGRRVARGERHWVHLLGLSAPDAGLPPSQARQVYERTARILRSLDMDFGCVARTWIWLRDILDWYPRFNDARTAVFAGEGLVASEGGARFLPASTGIGIAPAGNGACSLEVLAISDGSDSIRSRHAAGEQCSAFSYGSAFARAVAAPMPAGRTLFVSGTAAIDRQGMSEHPGDVRRQIRATLRHIRALIAEMEWSEDQIVSAIAYGKTAEVLRVFADEWPALPWPRVELIADVCRDELLFEMEVTVAERVQDGSEGTAGGASTPASTSLVE